MKTNLPSLISNIKKFQAVLVFGNDYGLISDSCDKIIKRLVVGPHTIFNLTRLRYADIIKNPGLLYNELDLLSLTRENKTIYISEVEKAMPAWLKETLTQTRSDVFIIFKALELPTSSAIRKLFENESTLAVIACYHDQRVTTENLIKAKLEQRNLTIDKPALEYLIASLGTDRLVTVAELDKLVLFAQEGAIITKEHVVLLTSQSNSVSLDDFCYNIACGNLTDLSKNLEQIIDSKTSIITIIRAILRLFFQLLKAKSAMESGGSAEQAMAKLAPPIFFKYAPIFLTCLKRYSRAQLQQLIADFTNLELLCKTTNTDHVLLFEHAVIIQYSALPNIYRR